MQLILLLLPDYYQLQEDEEEQQQENVDPYTLFVYGIRSESCHAVGSVLVFIGEPAALFCTLAICPVPKVVIIAREQPRRFCQVNWYSQHVELVQSTRNI
jgi:hypothetical protein